MNGRFWIFIFIILFFNFLFASTDVFYGPVSGTWTLAGSPYNVQGEINLPSNQTLTIEPGVEVIFQGCYRFIVNGRLIAQGTATDSIFFTAANQYTGWKGIRFINTTYNGQPGGVLNYCHFEYGKQVDNGTAITKGGVLLCLNSSNLLIQNSIFINNEARYGGAIAITNSSPHLQNIIVRNNFALSDGGGIYISSGSCPVISNSQITDNHAYCDGGGMFISGNSNPTLENCIISRNEAGYEYDCGGAGTAIWDAQATFENCLFTENHSFNDGGGLWIIYDAQVEVNNSIIARNHASGGAGILCYFSDLSLSGTSIYHNVALYSGGGIRSYEANIIFDQNNRNSIYSNISLSQPNQGFDIFINSQDFFEVYLDTFTVAVPTEVYAYPLANFTFDIQNHIYEPITSNIYVSVNGSNNNSGLNPSEPIKSLSQAVQMIQPESQNPLTIFIEDGVYSPSLTDEVLPICLKSYLSIQGTSRNGTIIDAENSSGIFRLEDADDVQINDLSIRNAEETEYSYGGGIDCRTSSLDLTNIEIKHCHSTYQAGGINLAGSSILNMTGTSIFNNTSNELAGAISQDYGSPIINFDPNNLCNIYLNNSSSGYEIYWYESPINVIVDTFTVLIPDENMVYPFSQFTFDISNSIYEPVAADLYVSPLGSNDNSGLTPTEPLKTIQRALQMIISTQTEPHTIYLAEGIYSPSSNGESFPITINDALTISGISRETTILDAEETNQVIQVIGNNVTIENLSVINGSFDFGAGIDVQGNYAHLEDLIIKDNYAFNLYYSYGFGGGINIIGSDAVLVDLFVVDNFACTFGGGIYLCDSVLLSGVTIKDNISLNQSGGGLYCDIASPVFDEDNLCNIMNNHSFASPSSGNDIGFYYNPGFSDDMLVYVDTFTVQVPSNYFANPIEHITFNIQNFYLSAINADVYVSPEGSNSNSGLTADDPFRSITYALQRVYADSLNPRIIYLAPGTYSPVVNGESFPLAVASYITIQGESKENTFLDGNAESRIIFCQNITNFIINDCTLKNAMHSQTGGAIFAEYSNLSMNKLNICQNHSSSFGGAIYAINSDLAISDSYLYYNSSDYGGCVYARNSQLTLLNNTICFNEAASGGAIYYRITDPQGEDQSAILVNQILWGNVPEQIYLRGTDTYTATMIIDHCDIEAGQAGVQFQGNYNLHWLDGNIDANPMFGEVENDFFMLQPESPCIDAGTAFFEWENHVYLDMQPDEYLGPAPDIGAWESEFTGSDIPQIPLTFALQQNFPNPFNPDTKIQFSLPQDCRVDLIIYNIKGQKVKQLINDQLAAGQHSVVWNGKDENGKQSASGIYFYKVKAEVDGKTKFEKTRKMMLLK
ncbi:MAG: FlgD immunoglobulin-like domain containing protein [Candidatus Cloacimonadales bacterium]|nr:FlgD immunoglobulin-like domain containing protein [Candidatus Cloacimonadales bacterium]